ncbi:MAG: glucuronate isomerase [Saprospiraceae bacterium]
MSTIEAISSSFIDANFLLSNDFAVELYQRYAATQPILDYHCHLSPEVIAQNQPFENLTQVWLAGDHYKWRAMRANGVPERFITGDADDKEKFRQWAATVPATLRNPLYHWTHLELLRYFGIGDLLHPRSADHIWQEANYLLQNDETLRPQGILRKMNVAVVCTTDDPCDSLASHRQIRDAGRQTRVLPTFRPDKAILITRPDYAAYIERLGAAADIEIRNFDNLITALERRMDYFAAQGCVLSDHGLERLYALEYDEQAANKALLKRLSGAALDAQTAEVFQSAILYRLCLGYNHRGWTQQFHLGALRDNNTRLLSTLGADTGFDSIGDFEQAVHLSRFLDRLDREDQLAKTILYNLNPADNEVFATMCGNFNDGSVPGKMQWGSAWWFLDQKDGIRKQIDCLSNMGLLSRFVGMLTDSRSFLSFPRHEYFRRILCNLLGEDIARGEAPADPEWIGAIVADVCYHNAARYFKMG